MRNENISMQKELQRTMNTNRQIVSKLEQFRSEDEKQSTGYSINVDRKHVNASKAFKPSHNKLFVRNLIYLINIYII